MATHQATVWKCILDSKNKKKIEEIIKNECKNFSDKTQLDDDVQSFVMSMVSANYNWDKGKYEHLIKSVSTFIAESTKHLN